jgi:hypothetical protein
VLNPITDKTVYANTLLSFAASATDTDQPPQSLTFSLGSGAPTGAAITTGGSFTWTPTPAQAPSTNNISVIVQDSGQPQMSATNSFHVVVDPAVVVQSAADIAGPFSDDRGAILDMTQRTITTSAVGTARFYRLRSSTALRIIQIQISGTQVELQYQ